MRKALLQGKPGRFTACVTDPPYELGFMGVDWDKTSVGFDPETWKAVYRVLKPGAPLLAFGGTRTYHRMVCAIEDAGFEIRDTLMWLYGSGFPKSHDISKGIDKAAVAEREVVGKRKLTGTARIVGGGGVGHDYDYGAFREEIPVTIPATDAAHLWDGWGTALKPAFEPIVLAMKPLDGTYAANALEHGVAGLNVDGCRIKTNGENPSEERRAAARKSGKAGSNLCSALKDVARYCEERPGKALGRWPANVILSHHPDCDGSCHPDCPVRMLGEQSGESTSPPRGSVANVKAHASFNGQAFAAGARECPNGHGDSGTAARFFYTAKASRAERGKGNTHPTVKPLDLMTYLVCLVKYPAGNRILDPFCGSGSTLLACMSQGIPAMGIDNNPKSIDIAEKRLRKAAGLLGKVEVRR